MRYIYILDALYFIVDIELYRIYLDTSSVRFIYKMLEVQGVY